tara:strand:+ start:343 stop:1479 length:1137 start_codon:yes stop_codon:yes gene_type:complete
LSQLKNNKNLRVLQIVPQLKFGGVERGVIDIMRFLNRKKIKNYILCESFNPDIIKSKEKKQIFTIYNYKFKNFFSFFKLNDELKKLIEKKKINLIHISSRAPAFIFYNLIKKNEKITYITGYHNPYSGDSIKKYYNSFLCRGNKIICNSKFTKKNLLENYNINKNKVVTIPRGIDINYFNPSLLTLKSREAFRDKLGVLKSEILIIIPSRFSNWKGHMQLILFLVNQPKFILERIKLLMFLNKNNIIEKGNLLKLCNEKFSNKIIFHNPIHDMRLIYHCSDITVNNSSKPEGFGRTISESLAMNKIPIGVNHGGVKEQLYPFDKKLLYKLNDQLSFNKALKYAINLTKKNNFNGRDYVLKNYSLNTMLNTTLDVYLNG